MKGNKMPIKITPIKKKKKSKVDPDQKKFQESLKNFKNPKPKKMQKGGATNKKPNPKLLKDVMNKKFKQEATMRNSVYQSSVKKKPPSKGVKKFIEGIGGTGPDFQYKVETGKAAKRAISDTAKSMKKESPELMKRVAKKKSGGVIKANMGKLLETFSPAYSMMKGKGPVSSILSAVGGSGLGGPASIFAKQQRDKAKKRRMEMSGEKENTNRMTPATPAAGMKKGGSLKKKKSIDGIASKGKTRGV